MAAKKENKFISIRMLRLLMKTVGFWTAETKNQERLLNGILSYTICAIGMAFWIEGYEFLIYSRGDFYALTYTACSAMPILIILLKIGFFLHCRKDLLQMLRYTQDNFWFAQYDEYGEKLLKYADRKGAILICSFTFFVQGTVATYTLAPIIENKGKNVSDKILPFNIWIGVPTNVSPNFEILFCSQILALVHSGLCFCCFDNLLSLLNLHTAVQFKLLQRQLESILTRIEVINSKKFIDMETKQEVYEELKKCIKLHHELIWYSDKMESIFMYTTLCQLLVSSIMLCVAGFQVFLSRGTLIRRMIFIAHTNGCFFQVFLITFTSNELIDESRAVGDAAYNANWQILSHEDNRAVRSAILMIMMRSMHPCSISAGGFFPVSLQTFTAVLSTAASYFTLLRNFALEQEPE